MKLLLVEDDKLLKESLLEQFKNLSYDIAVAGSVQEALDKIKTEGYSLIIVDIGLPDGSGFVVAREAKIAKKLPVIMLTAMISAEFRLEAFEIGVDDYIPKPFHFRELILRIEKVLNSYSISNNIKVDGLSLDLKAGSLILSDGRIEFPAQREFLLIKALITKSPNPISREEVIANIWSAGGSGGGEANFRSVDNAIVKLRSIVGEDRIRSVRGVGYQWI